MAQDWARQVVHWEIEAGDGVPNGPTLAGISDPEESPVMSAQA